MIPDDIRDDEVQVLASQISDGWHNELADSGMWLDNLTSETASLSNKQRPNSSLKYALAWNVYANDE